MNNILKSLLLTIGIFFLSLIVIAPIISMMGNSSVEGSYHVITYALLLSLIFVVILSTDRIIKEIRTISSSYRIKNK